MTNDKNLRERLRSRQESNDQDEDANNNGNSQEGLFEKGYDSAQPESNTAKETNKPGHPAPGGLLADDDIEGRYGNYLISIGYGGSGKTTFQSFLVYYLTHASQFNVEHVVQPSGSAQGWAPQAIYNDWITRWRSGYFPLYTTVGEAGLRELSFHVQPRSGKKVPLDLNFLEVSGENLRQIVAGDDGDPLLLKTLGRFFENPQIKWTFCLVIDPVQGGANDRLFDNFYQYLRVNFPDVLKDASLAVLVSKPEEALAHLNQLRSGFEHYQSMRGDVLESYIAEVAPRTNRILDSWQDESRTAIVSLYVGDVEEGQEEIRIRRKDYRDIQQIFEWLYAQFTGTGIGPTWWQRVLAWLKE